MILSIIFFQRLPLVLGVYFKYDFSPLIVRVTEKGRPFWQFLVRLCGIIGGIFATSGIPLN